MPTESLALVIGAGGHARVVLDALLATEPDALVVVRDDCAALENHLILKFRVKTPVRWEEDGAARFHVAIGHNATRKRLLDEGSNHGRRPFTICHPAATVSRFCVLGAGVFVAARAVVAPGATIRDGVIINHGAIVDHDCMIESCVHLAPLAALGGGVQVGAGALIGAGATILPGRKIGANAVVGAGAVVTHDVAAGATVVGVPANLLPHK